MSDKKKNKRKKPLSDEEKERRILMRNERIERKKRKNKHLYLKIFFPLLALLLFVIIGFLLDIWFGISVLIPYYAICLILIAVLTDRSGIRSLLFLHYPEKFIFSEELKKDYSDRSFIMELARTCCYFSLAMFFLCPPLIKLWASVIIVSIAIGFFYIITDTDNKYTFDKFSKYSDTTTFLIFTGIFGLLQFPENISIKVIVIGTIVLTGLYLIFGNNPKKAELTFEMIIFAPINIAAILFLLSLFTK